jgi:hypothetical protein
MLVKHEKALVPAAKDGYGSFLQVALFPQDSAHFVQ